MTDSPMYNVANAVLCRSLAIVRSLPLPGFVNSNVRLQLPQFSDVKMTKVFDLPTAIRDQGRH